MVGDAGVHDIGASRSRHVTDDTVIVFRLSDLQAFRTFARIATVACLTFLVVECIALCRCRATVGIVARRAAEPALAVDEATADVQLFELADGPAKVHGIGMADKQRDERLQRQPRAKLEDAASAAIDFLLSLQMALSADTRLEAAGKVLRIDNRVIDAIDRCIAQALGNVQFPRPVTVLQPIDACPMGNGSLYRLIDVGIGTTRLTWQYRQSATIGRRPPLPRSNPGDRSQRLSGPYQLMGVCQTAPWSRHRYERPRTRPNLKIGGGHIFGQWLSGRVLGAGRGAAPCCRLSPPEARKGQSYTDCGKRCRTVQWHVPST